jgi:hypothetical protein
MSEPNAILAKTSSYLLVQTRQHLHTKSCSSSRTIQQIRDTAISLSQKTLSMGMPYRLCEYRDNINGYFTPSVTLILRKYAAVLTQPRNRSIPSVGSQIALQTIVVKTCDKCNWKAVMQPEPVNQYLCHE